MWRAIKVSIFLEDFCGVFDFLRRKKVVKDPTSVEE